MIEKAHDLPPAEDGDVARDGLPEAAPVRSRARSPRRSSRALPEGDDMTGAPVAPAASPEAAPADGESADRDAVGLRGEARLQGGDITSAGGDELPTDPSADVPAEQPADLAAASAQLPLGARIEALLFASAQPLAPQRIANVLDVDVAAVHAALAGLVSAWGERPGAVDLVEIAGGFRFLTRPEFHADVGNLRGKTGTERLSPAALETLAVVAYRQPIGRAEVEAVRGVQVGPVLRLLLDRDLIRVTGRSTEPGHPLLYGTTRRFLDHFGLKSLKALPDLKDLLESP